MKNRSINAITAKAIHIDVDYEYVADANAQKVAVHRDDVDSQSVVAYPAGVALLIDDVEN